MRPAGVDTGKAMNRQLSAYLNLLRITAALAVFFAHLCIWQMNCSLFSRVPDFGDDGVVAFFVLSGYVIAYTADVKDDTPEKYAISRLTRIYSVVIPAIGLTIALEWAGTMMFPRIYDSIYDSYQFHHLWLYLPLWLSFSSESWHLNEPIFTNGAFWSLCFEVWFYIGFAIWLFLPGIRRTIGLVGVLLLVGPKIALLSILWLIGAGSYRLQRQISLSRRTARLLAAMTLVAFVGVIWSGVDVRLSAVVNTWLGGYPEAHLQMAWKVPGYSVLALLLAANIFCMRFAMMDFLAAFARPLGFVASFTFSFYIVHLPLLRFYTALLASRTSSMALPAALTVATTAVFGQFTERRASAWRSVFSSIIKRWPWADRGIAASIATSTSQSDPPRS